MTNFEYYKTKEDAKKAYGDIISSKLAETGQYAAGYSAEDYIDWLYEEHSYEDSMNGEFPYFVLTSSRVNRRAEFPNIYTFSNFEKVKDYMFNLVCEFHKDVFLVMVRSESDRQVLFGLDRNYKLI